jgi:hypothetical protein
MSGLDHPELTRPVGWSLHRLGENFPKKTQVHVEATRLRRLGPETLFACSRKRLRRPGRVLGIRNVEVAYVSAALVHFVLHFLRERLCSLPSRRKDGVLARRGPGHTEMMQCLGHTNSLSHVN